MEIRACASPQHWWRLSAHMRALTCVIAQTALLCRMCDRRWQTASRTESHVQEKGCSLDQWSIPNATLWSERQHLDNYDLRYASKLDAFQDLVDRSKLSSLNLTSHSQAQPPAPASHGEARASGALGSVPTSRNASQVSNAATVPERHTGAGQAAASGRVLLVSDFPHLNGPEAREKLCNMLALLAQTASAPVVVLVTESGALCRTCCTYKVLI